ncbi:MAG: c-type cytochrome [Candidatus Sulfotelmatobacter sp.]
MQRPVIGLLATGILLAVGMPPQNVRNAFDQALIADAAAPFSLLRVERASPSDLEVSGDLAGLAPGTTRYLKREDLLTLPQVSYTVTDDANFNGPTQISGVLMEELNRKLAAAPESDMLVAICSDQYRANYPHAYIAEHHPLLVLKINGQPPAGWPKDRETHGYDMGPYLISHAKFSPAFKIFSQPDEAQIPWGVVRLEFRNEETVFGAIAPRGPQAADELVQAGYRIAQQNCFRCHNMGREGGMKAGRPWRVLSAWATASPKYFADYVRNPQSKNPRAQMPGNPGYDDATIGALTAYFKTFSASDQENPRPEEKEKP